VISSRSDLMLSVLKVAGRGRIESRRSLLSYIILYVPKKYVKEMESVLKHELPFTSYYEVHPLSIKDWWFLWSVQLETYVISSKPDMCKLSYSWFQHGLRIVQRVFS